jgi:serine/threonine-protein kinase
VEGPTLKQIIRDHVRRYDRPLPINRALDLTIQICNGIGYAHRAGLVHCDLKPQNVLVTRDERVKVADFGIARAISQASLYDHDVVWGTPQYFAPEQAAGEAATPASDVYAIGIILFEALTGRLPFDAESHTEMALKHLRETPPPVSRFNPNVPRQLEDIIKKVLAKEPAGRYRTGGQLGRILSTYRDSSQQATPPRPPAEMDTPPPGQRGGPGYTVAVIPQQDEPAGRAGRRPQTAARAERETAYYGGDGGRPAVYDGSRPAERQTTSERPTAIHIPAPPSDRTDWLAITLGIAALVALLGLIPLWYLVYQAWIP